MDEVEFMRLAVMFAVSLHTATINAAQTAIHCCGMWEWTSSLQEHKALSSWNLCKALSDSLDSLGTWQLVGNVFTQLCITLSLASLLHFFSLCLSVMFYIAPLSQLDAAGWLDCWLAGWLAGGLVALWLCCGCRAWSPCRQMRIDAWPMWSPSNKQWATAWRQHTIVVCKELHWTTNRPLHVA